MGYLEQILLQIYFPQFHSPNKSRFESFFVSKIKIENENPLNKNIYKSLSLSLICYFLLKIKLICLINSKDNIYDFFLSFLYYYLI